MNNNTQHMSVSKLVVTIDVRQNEKIGRVSSAQLVKMPAIKNAFDNALFSDCKTNFVQNSGQSLQKSIPKQAKKIEICGRANQTVRGNKERKKKRFNHQERIEFLYQAAIHKETVNKITNDTQQKYTTIYTILKDYQNHGRTNRLLNYQEKVNKMNIRT